MARARLSSFSSDPDYKQKLRDETNKVLDEFDPNQQKHPFATYIPDRRPPFKVHSGRGTAISAFGYGRPGILSAWENARWVELCKVYDREAKKCENCGGELIRTYTTYNGGTDSYREVRYLFVSQPQWHQVHLCHTCGDRLKRTPTQHRGLDRLGV
jgi:hypothetical protein